MKILHLTQNGINHISGISQVLKYLVPAQNQIETITSRIIAFEGEKTSDEISTITNSIDEIKCYIKNFKPDICIFHGVYFINYVAISYFLYKSNIPYLIQPHSSFGRNAQKKSFIKKYLSNITVFRSFIKKAYGLIFLNNNEKETSVVRSKVEVVIPNGVNEYYPQLNFHDDESNIVKLFFIGRIDIYHKGLDILLNSLINYPMKIDNVEYHIYGNGNKKNLYKLQNLIRKVESIKVFFHGRVLGEEKHEALSKNDIFVLTSRYEGFPVSVLEALSYGKPVIITEGTNVTDIVKNNELGWIIDNKNIDLNLIIDHIAEYKNNKIEYMKKCNDFVNYYYTWNKVAQKSINVLEEILK